MPHRRSAYFISDRTAITAEALGLSLLTQFESLNFKKETVPFIDTVEKAQALAIKIQERSDQDHHRPIVFTSIVNPSVRNALKIESALVLDFFETFISTLEDELQEKASPSIGRAHGMSNEVNYGMRIDAVNFSLNHDDGIKLKDLDDADVILLGVSRSGKTPTCLYLALQYGIRAANYPLTPEDLSSPTLPKTLLAYRNKLFGLTIDPARLHHIRNERRPNSTYASLDNCRAEVNEAESMFRHHSVPFISTTHKSIEEISTTIMHTATLTRRF